MNILFSRQLRAFAVSFCIISGSAMLLPALLFAQSGNIHIAVLEGDYEAVKRSLDEGVSPDEYNSTGFAPLHSAARADRGDIINLLLSYGGDVNIQTRTRIDPLQGGLHIAARNGYLGLVRLLLSRGADPNIQDSRGNTPLHDAAISGDIAITRALIRGGANVAVRNTAGDDVLSVAAESLGSAAFSRTRFSVPITLSPQFDFDDLTSSPSNGLVNGLLRTDIEGSFSALFPIGDTNIFIGPEGGLSLSIPPLFTNTLIIHLPIRGVVSFDISYNLSIEGLIGTKLNIWSEERIMFADLTFDIGARVDVSGFLIGLHYTLPFSLPLGDPQFKDISDSQSLQAYTEGYWQNALTLSFGYRIQL